MAYQSIPGLDLGRTERGDCSERWEKIYPELYNEGVLLDVGCAEGYFLKQAAENTNLLCIGIEKEAGRVRAQLKWLTKEHRGKVIACHGVLSKGFMRQVAETCEVIDVGLALSVLHWVNDDQYIKDLATVCRKLIVEIPPPEDTNATGQKFMNRIRQHGGEKEYFEAVTGRSVRFLARVKSHTASYRNLWVIEGPVERVPSIPHMNNFKGKHQNSYHIRMDNEGVCFTKAGEQKGWVPGINLATVKEMGIVFPEQEWWDNEVTKSVDNLYMEEIVEDLRCHNLIVSREEFNWIDLDHRKGKTTVYTDIEGMCNDVAE
jgi:hypothetical protein